MSKLIKQREALEDAIKHWEENVQCAREHKPLDISHYGCACCQEWFVDTSQHLEIEMSRNQCSGCPIHEYTGRTHCDGTPYYVIRCAIDRVGSVQARLVKTEVNFLRTVLSWVNDKIKKASQS